MDDRLLLVAEENRRHLAGLLDQGDPAVAEAVAGYRVHLLRTRNLARQGVRVEEIPSFFQSDEGKQVLSQPPRTVIGLVATLMADRVARVRSQPRFTPLSDVDHLTERVLDRLAGRRLPFVAADAAVLVDLAAAYPWLEQIRVALNAARLVLDSDEAPEVVDALRRFDSVFTEEPKSLLVSKVMSYHHQVRALLAAKSADAPVPLVTDDAFGPAALELIRADHADWDSTEALAFLALPRGTRAPRSWWQEAEDRATGSRHFARLVVDLLDLVATVDLTDGTQETHGFYRPDVVLLGEVNTIIVRGAAWSARFVTGPRVDRALGRAALRCSSLVRGPWGVDPMNSKVAYAAVDSLAAGSAAAHGELEQLLTEVQAIPVLRRVAEHLGVPETEIKAMIKARRPHRYVHRTD